MGSIKVLYNSLTNLNSTRELLNISLIIVFFNRIGRYFRNKKREYLKAVIRKLKSMSLQQTVRTRTSETFIEK
jgi:hypothetical protein